MSYMSHVRAPSYKVRHNLVAKLNSIFSCKCDVCVVTRSFRFVSYVLFDALAVGIARLKYYVFCVSVYYFFFLSYSSVEHWNSTG